MQGSEVGTPRRRERKAWTLAGIAVLSTLSLAPPLAAEGKAAKTALQIDVVAKRVIWYLPVGSPTSGSGTFKLLGANAADSDRGTVTFKFSSALGTKTEHGQFFQSIRHTKTLKGKHGGLVIHSTGRQFPIGTSLFGNDTSYVLTGTWSIFSGTGSYAGLKGGGEFVALIVPNLRAGVPDEYDFSYRYEGLVTRS